MRFPALRAIALAAMLTGCGPAAAPQKAVQPTTGLEAYCLRDAEQTDWKRLSSDRLSALKKHYALCRQDVLIARQIVEVLVDRNDPDAMYELSVMLASSSKPEELARSKALMLRAAALGDEQAKAEVANESEKEGR